MSFTTNSHDGNAATGATVSNHITGVGPHDASTTRDVSDMPLTSRNRSDDHAPRSASLTGSRNGHDENEQAHDTQIDQLYKDLQTWTREMMVFTSRLWLYILRRIWEREAGRHRSDLQEYEDIQNISLDRLRQLQEHIDHDAHSASQLSALSKRYKVLKRSTGSALRAANQTLANLFLLSGRRKSHQQAQEAVSRFEKDIAAFNRSVNEMVLRELLSDS
ncbi:hypothetical protein KCU77_g1393, partial [Aureobasidium melanogenum]